MVRVHASASRHEVHDDDIAHAYARPVAVIDLDPEAEPPKILVIGPGRSGNLLVIHAMPLRPIFYRYLPDPTE
jgi:hypothetical protein